MLEIAANWNGTLRELLTSTKFDECVKVVFSALISFGFLNMEEAKSLQEVQVFMPDVQLAAALPLALVGAAFCGALTAFLVQLRSVVANFIHLIDPDNDFHLQTMFVGAEESLALFILTMAILLPILAFIITLIVIAAGKIVQVTLKKLEESTNHPCTACGKSISSLAEKCPECGAAQKEVYAVGLFGLPGKELIDQNDAEQLHIHHQKMLLLHRCPHCATHLHYSTCDNCHAELWKEGEAREIVQTLDRRVIVIALVGLLVNGIPIIGFPCFLISFNTLDGCAKDVVRRCAKAGVTLTPAGATYPGGKDPHDSNIRIAPTYPTLAELKTAMETFTLCVRIASAKKILADRAAK